MSIKPTIIKRAGYLSAFWFLPLIVSANYGLDDAAGTAGLVKTGSLAQRSGQLVGSLLSLVGVVFLILMVYGGVTWMTASGNDKQVEKAKNTITYAVIGLVIILSAYAITAFLGSELAK